MSDVFISYARGDAATARRFADALEAAGYGVWWDDALRSGEDFDEKIEAALRAAKAVVVLWSKASAASRWVRAEATLADRNNTLVPVTIEACDRPIIFELKHTADLTHWRGDANDKVWLAVLADVQKLVGSTKTTPKPATPEKRTGVSVCVLPFTNMSGEAEQEYFSDGISEDIITDLSKVSALWVAARNTSFTFKGKIVDVPQIAKQLGVSHVLEGSVRKAGNRVRITAQLIDAGGGHVWAERYDRDLNDIFAVQDEISEAIVKVLKVKLHAGEKRAIEARGTSNAQAYKYYLLARQFRESGNTTKRTLDAVIRLCERAVELDPNYAQAWALIGNAKERMNFQGATEYDATDAVERALALDDKLAEAHALKARLLGNKGQYEEAEREIDMALALDPSHPTVNHVRASLHFFQGRMREAAPFYERLAEVAEADCPSVGMLGTIYSALGETENAVYAARRCVARAEAILAREPDNCTIMSWLVGALAILGEKERAREWIDRALILDPVDFNMRYNFACALVREMNDHQAALELLKPTFDAAPLSAVNWIKVDPDMDALREHPRFKAMLAEAEARLAAKAAGD